MIITRETQPEKETQQERKQKGDRIKLNMTSSQKNLNTKENGKKETESGVVVAAVSMWVPDDDPNVDWDHLEDLLNKKKKIRLNSKYSEKRYIP